MHAAVDCVVPGADTLGESCIWDERARRLWWVDGRGPALRSFDPANGALTRLALSETVGSVAFREDGGMLAALRSGVYRLDPATGATEALARPEASLPDNRFNDGRCDRAGRFWVGTMNDARRAPSGALYRIAADGTCVRQRGDIIVPNSIAWSPDDRTLYFADTYRHVIRAYDFDRDAGTIARERVFADCSGHPGHPDGSCVDTDGGLWNAEYGGWRVVRYDPSGRIDRVIEVPVQNPTCCCFGGDALDVLYITSATQRLTPEELARQPLAGSVFAVRPGAQGLPEARFAA